MSNEVLEFLISKITITEIDVKSNTGKTPLHNAAKSGSINSIRALVENGANINVLDNEGKTPFNLVEEDKEKAKYLAEKMGEALRSQGKYADALEVYKKLLNIQITKTAPHVDTLQTESNIALMLYEEKKFDEAMQLFKAVHSKRNDLHGSCHFNTLHTKYYLGKVLFAQFDYDKALECFKEVFEEWRDSLGADNKETLTVECDLASAYSKKGEYDEAFKLFSHVFECRKKTDPKHPNTLTVWLDMAIVLVNKGESEKALRILKEIHDAREASLGADHKDTICVAFHIKAVLQRLKDEAPARNWGNFFQGWF